MFSFLSNSGFQTDRILRRNTRTARRGPGTCVERLEDRQLLSAAAPPVYLGTQIDDGNRQRSEIRSLTFSFSSAVTLSDGAITLAQLIVPVSNPDEGNVPPDPNAALDFANASSPDGGMSWTIPFLKSVPGVTDGSGSLVDNVYKANINASLVTDSLGQPLNGGDQFKTFFRLFGDVNGDDKVSNTDFTYFSNAFGSSFGQPKYNRYFDYSGLNARIGNSDLAQFSSRFGKSFGLTAPVITAPTNLTVSAGGSLSYQVVATGNPAPNFSLVSAPPGMTISATGLISWAQAPTTLGAQSIVTVSVANAAGSTTSTFAITTVPDTTPPTAPTVTVGPVTATDSIPLSWTGATDDVGVVGYRIYTFTPAVYAGHSGRGGGWRLVSPAKYTLLIDNITSTSYTITGLTPYTTYQYAVTAFDAAGNQSPYSAVVIGTTLLSPSFTWTLNGVTQDPAMSVVANHPLSFLLYTSGSPAPTLSLISAPAGVTFIPGVITTSQLTYVTPTINWTPTADQTGINYITMQATNSVGTFTYAIPITVTPDTPQLSISLNGGIAYGAAQFAAGQSNYQVTVNPAFGSAANPQYGFSGTPFNFQVTAATNTNPTTFSLISGPAGMTIDPNTGAGAWTPTKDQAGNTSVTIAATNGAGTSTLELSFPTYFTGAPGKPAATYYTTTSGSVSPNPTMTWTAPADTVGIAGYILKVTAAQTGVTTTFDTHSTDTSYALSGLTSVQYFVTVTPYDASGNPGQTSPAVSIYALGLPNLSWTISTPNAVVGTPLTIQFSAGNSSGLTYSIVSGPTGAAIDPNTGLLTWTPTDAGNAMIIVSSSSPNGWGTVDAVLNIPVSA
ncbi:MAG: 1,4-beta cellobiohydrolase [Phycisphaerales bacterium]|nr:1,4-beta cellobiohydrolase [Phycisphaerales bacterium]